MRKGLALPNRTWEPWAAEEMAAVIDLGPEVVQALVFRQQPEGVWQAQKFQLQDLYRAINCEFEYRMCGVGPSESPEYAVTWLEDKLSGLPVGKIIPFNEPNLAGEGWVGTDWVVWARRFALSWKARGFPDKLVTPALSPNGDMGQFFDLFDLVKQGYYDYLGIHWYEDSHHALPVGMPVCITECNGALPHRIFDGLTYYENIEEAIWFSSFWLAPDPGYCWDLIGNPKLLESFKAWKQQEANMPEFRYGVKDEADRLRSAGVDPGEPLQDEYWFIHDLAVQPTTTGQFWVHKVAGTFHVQFHPKAIGGQLHLA